MLNVKIEVRIKKIHCGNTEDIHGEDELYLTSILSDGSSNNTQAAIVGKMGINDNQTKNPNEIIFSGTLPTDRSIRGGLGAFDEDSGKDWSKKPEWVAYMKDGVVTGLSSSGNPKAVVAGQIIAWGYTGIDKLMKADKDDHLGQQELNIPVSGPEKENIVWHFWNEGDWLGYSSWNYSVDIEIIRTRESLYTAVWRKSNVGDYCVYDWKRDDLLTKAEELRNEGMRLHLLQAYVKNGQELWNAVFHPSNVDDYVVLGWKRDDLLTKAEELRNDGMRFHLLQAYVQNGQELWNAVFHPSNVDDYAVLGWKRDDFVAKDSELRKGNMRLHILQAYVQNGQELWNAVWQPSDSKEISVYGWAYNDYRKKYDQLWNEGWRLHILQAYVYHGQVLYNAVWRPSDSGEIQVYGWKRADFVAKDKELRNQNMRLHTILTY